MVAEGTVNREIAAKYAGQFREIRLLRDLTVLPRDRGWREGPPPVEAEPHRVVLYLGCNVLRTSHMVRTVIDVFDSIGVDYVAVGGAAYCCGSPYQRGGDKELADSVAARTVRFFERYQPERVVMWCPSCIYLYDEVYDIPASYQTQQVAEFLAEHIAQFKFARAEVQRVALHYHSNRPRRVQEGRAAEALLSAVPGLELARTDTDARLDRACTEANQQKLGVETWQGIIEGQFQGAVGEMENLPFQQLE